MTENTFRPVRHDLYTRFGHRAETAVIDTILDEVIAEHVANARVPDFLPVLVYRDAAERIEDHLWTHGAIGTPRKKILFASRTNAARAIMAASMARNLSDNAVVTTVADTHPENRGDALVEWVMDERGLRAGTVSYRSERERTLAAADIVVYLDDQESVDLPGRTFVQWDVPSTDGMSIEQIRRFAEDLETRVAGLLVNLDVLLVPQSDQRLAA